MGKHEYLNYQNKLYYIFKRVNSNRIKSEYIQEIKNFWLCDIVLKYNQHNEDVFIFLREVSELEILS